ncbi:hypothetical protein BABAYKA_00120 [Brevundimonas phage vB_BpoS-Babayka]|uniref:Uncharacterized protein n=1 Tax=Brevundimonas phage vB_BpoS-Babayka TaxID=2948596 RepID=A0A9E7MUM0_9CAUD|nr:hypothetical protein BABAYKA_00120 [Brevundimonas phage vB_BpoS-Babayka]
MRDTVLFPMLEGIARRSPGWGTPVSLPQEDGTVLRMRVSLANAFRNLIRPVAPQPRADKGSAYITDTNGTRRVLRHA